MCRKKGARLARVEGFEPPAPGLEGLCSIQLSYTRQVMVAPPNKLAMRGPESSIPKRQECVHGLFPRKNRGLKGQSNILA